MGDVPPNLRIATGDHRCANCQMFNAGRHVCTSFGDDHNFPVGPGEVCDVWQRRRRSAMRPFELRKEDSKTVSFDGYPSVFNKTYTVGPMKERVAPGAFARSLSRRDLDVVLRVEHKGLPLARTTSGTLRLNEDDKGLRARADLDARDPEVQSLLVKYERGDLREMSFAFRCERDSFSEDYQTRTVHDANVHRGDVSIVTFGASSSTSSSLTRTEMRAFTRKVSDTGWFGPGLSRQAIPPVDADGDFDDDGDQVPCPACGGDGIGSDGMVCGVCNGVGTMPADWDEDDDPNAEMQPTRSVRRDYTDKEKAQLGKAGKAVYYDGSWHFPTLTRKDYDNAVQALGRTPGRNRVTVRKYLIKRAKQEGWPIPSSWNSDGTTKTRSALIPVSRLAEFEAELAGVALAPQPSVLRRAHRGHTERDKSEHLWLERRFSAWGVEE